MYMEKPSSYFDRIFNRPRSIWTIFLVSLVLLALPFIFALLDGYLEQFLTGGQWRRIISPTAIALYIWIISLPMSRASDSVVAALRPLIELDQDDFQTQVSTAENINPLHEFIAFGIGLLLGVAAASSTDMNQGFSWIKAYWFLSTCLMYAVLAWTIFIAVASTRINAALHRLPMRVDILNPAPFEAVGRQSLLLALVFIGGITISLVLTYDPAQLSAVDFWISNLLLVVFTVSIFFLSMRPTHLVLAAEKKRQLDPLSARINRACGELVLELEGGNNQGGLSTQITALVAYEERLQAARTWPYNISILRTLFFSVFIPLMSILVRVAVDLLFP
jgi:hypothetical protein